MLETYEVNLIAVITENQFGEVEQNSPKEELQNIQSSYWLKIAETTYCGHKWWRLFLKGNGRLSHLMGNRLAQNDPIFVE